MEKDFFDDNMEESSNRQKVVVVGAGPVGALAALYAATRGDIVEVYELRAGTHMHIANFLFPLLLSFWQTQKRPYVS